MSLIPYEEAFARVMARVRLTEEVDVPISSSVALVSVEDVVAPDPVPPFANTAVDGFAVRAVDVRTVPIELEVVATIAAGVAPSITLQEGTCARIMTGAVIPDGADAVVMVEDTEVADRTGTQDVHRREGGAVRILATVEPGRHVRPAGDDLARGDVAIAAGTVIKPAHVGLLATIGASSVRVRRRPRVGVISTGDELVPVGIPLRMGQIRDSNRVMLLALCEQAAVQGVDLGLIADDESAIETALAEAAGSCDAIITSGGVSMGDYDYVKAVLGRIGDMEWMQVAIKPAKPFAFGVIDGTPVFGLPGNPVSSLVSFELFARPGLAHMMGHRRPHRRRLSAVAGTEFVRRSDAKTHFVRVTLARRGDDLVAEPTGGQGSHQLSASAGADGLAVIPDGEGIGAGARVEVIPLGS